MDYFGAYTVSFVPHSVFFFLLSFHCPRFRFSFLDNSVGGERCGSTSLKHYVSENDCEAYFILNTILISDREIARSKTQRRASFVVGKGRAVIRSDCRCDVILSSAGLCRIPFLLFSLDSTHFHALEHLAEM